jgi:hypothetical protein
VGEGRPSVALHIHVPPADRDIDYLCHNHDIAAPEEVVDDGAGQGAHTSHCLLDRMRHCLHDRRSHICSLLGPGHSRHIHYNRHNLRAVVLAWENLPEVFDCWTAVADSSSIVDRPLLTMCLRYSRSRVCSNLIV